MILVTLGTQDKEFSRLLEKIENEIKNKKIKDKVVVQAGHTKFKSKYMEIKKIVPMDEFDKLVSDADVIITHGGVGSIITGLKNNKKVIALARLKKYGEHVNDHQLQIIENFSKNGYILNLDDFDSVSDAIRAAKKFKPKKYNTNRDNMVKLVSNYIDDEIKMSKQSDNINRSKFFDTKTITILTTSFVFLIFYIICTLAPISGDDFGNYIHGATGINDSIKNAIANYKVFEGRFFGRIFINILTYHKIIWNLLNALCITGIFYCGSKMMKNKNYFFPLVFLLGILLVDVQAFTQGYIWLAGSITYLFPTAFLVLAIYMCQNIDNKKRYIRYSLPILSFIFSMFVENVAIAITSAFLLFSVIDYLDNHKVNKVYISSFFFSLIGSCLTIFSPGNSGRLEYHPYFKSLNIIGKIKYNIPNFISYTFIRNTSFLLILTLLLLFLINKYCKNKYIKGLLYTSLIILPITAILNYIRTLGVNIDKSLFLFNSHNYIILCYYAYIILISSILLFKYYNDYKGEKISFIILVCGVISNLSMFLSPIWGGRTVLPTILLLMLCFLIILSTIIKNINKWLNIILAILVIVISCFFVVNYYQVNKKNKIRERHIKQQLQKISDEEKEEIKSDWPVVIDPLSERFLWNPNPWNQDGYLARTFKRYYKIKEDRKIEVKHEY